MIKLLNVEVWGHEIMTGKPFNERIAIPYKLDEEKEKSEYQKQGIVISEMKVITTFYMSDNLL